MFEQGDGATITAAGGDAAGIIIDDVIPSSVEYDPKKAALWQTRQDCRN
jgi:hypothetical protein